MSYRIACLLQIALWLAQLGGRTACASSQVTDSTNVPDTLLIWEEEFPLESKTNSPLDKAPRKILSTEKSERPPSPLAPSRATHPRHTPHKLRTDRWELNLRWRRGSNNTEKYQQMELEFSDNGYVRWVSADNSTAAIGKWELASHGVTWNLPDGMIFHGDLLLNPFGTQPRIIRGVVMRETPRAWFRPVVATFTAKGIGEDTADLSYRNRKSSH